MPEIDIKVSQQYAQGTQIRESYEKDLKVPLSGSSSVLDSVSVAATTPLFPQIDQVMGETEGSSWANFEPPPGTDRRVSRSYILGTPEQVNADSQRLNAYLQENPTPSTGAPLTTGSVDPALAGQTLSNMLAQANNYNSMVQTIYGNMNAFLPG